MNKRRGDVLDTEFEGKDVELSDHRVFPGEDLNLTNKDPTLRKIMLGCGWDLNVFQGEEIDVDISIFLLDKNDQTREDADFVFYNNMTALDSAVIHHGDNRTGAGDGDDEQISINLQELPFDILRIAVVVSIYQGYEKDQPLNRIKNGFIRLANSETQHELLRYELSHELADHDKEFAMIAAYIDRVGPNWHFKPVTEFYEGGLAEIATKFAIVVLRQ